MIALHDNGGDVGRTAAQFSMPYKTVYSWSRGSHHAYLLEFRKAQKDDMAAAYETATWVSLGQAMGKAPDAAFNHLMTGAGIATDKMLLLRGEATQRSESKNLNVSRPAVDVSRLTPAEAYELYKLLRKAGAALPDAERPGVVPGEPAGVPVRELPADGTEPGGDVSR